MKNHFKFNPMNSINVLQDQQKKYLNDFKVKKAEELKMLLENEKWIHQQVNPIYQKILDKINSIEEFEKDEKI